MMGNLLLCPFCGGLAAAESKDMSTKIRCLDDNCGAGITRFRLADDHLAAASAAWNRRAEIAEVSVLLRLLGQAYDDAAKFGLPAQNRPLWEEVWVTTAREQK